MNSLMGRKARLTAALLSLACMQAGADDAAKDQRRLDQARAEAAKDAGAYHKAVVKHGKRSLRARLAKRKAADAKVAVKDAKRAVKMDAEKVDIAARKTQLKAIAKDLPEDRREIGADRARVEAARKSNDNAAFFFGQMSPQGQATDEELVRANADLHAQRADIRGDKHHAAVDRAKVDADQAALKKQTRERWREWLSRLNPFRA